MVPLKTMNVIPRRIALNVEVIGDVRNVMVVVTWIAMCAMAMDSAGIVEAMAERDAQSVAEADNADIVVDQGKFFVGIAMVVEKNLLVNIGKNAQNVAELAMRHALSVLQ